jgi:hypothetical protein
MALFVVAHVIYPCKHIGSDSHSNRTGASTSSAACNWCSEQLAPAMERRAELAASERQGPSARSPAARIDSEKFASGRRRKLNHASFA